VGATIKEEIMRVRRMQMKADSDVSFGLRAYEKEGGRAPSEFGGIARKSYKEMPKDKYGGRINTMAAAQALQPLRARRRRVWEPPTTGWVATGDLSKEIK
jgi:hypothetical protein